MQASPAGQRMGPRQEAQAALFYEFCIEDHVPQDHLLRSIDRFVELSDIRRHLAPFYSSIGRPSIDPELMVRMLLVGYCMGIRSERRLCEEVHLNLAYRWFCRLDLTDTIPDHSTFSKNRYGRFRESDLLRQVFETVVARCITEGLVSGQRLAVDASLIAADANRRWPAHPDTLLLRGCDLVPDAFCGDLPLELGERQQDIQDKPSHGRGRVELLGDGDKRHLVSVEQFDHAGEVHQRPCKPVDLDTSVHSLYAYLRCPVSRISFPFRLRNFPVPIFREIHA